MAYFMVNHEALEDYCRDIFAALGVPPGDAAVTAKSLVDADLRNVASHGVVRVSNYIGHLKAGTTKAKPDITVVSETPSTAVLDADFALGQVVSEQAVRMCREKAKACGLGYVAVRRSNHYGAAGYWALKLAGDDMVGASGSNVQPGMCVTGGKSGGIGNNPISFAFPAKQNGAFCYDIACSQMAFGKTYEYKALGKPLPEGAFMDANGQPTTDAADAKLMAPFGGHKGYGLAVVVELLCSIMAGGAFGSDIGRMMEFDSYNNLAHYFMAFDIAAFRPVDAYTHDTDAFADYLHGLPKAEGVERILTPGELERESKERQLKEGLRLRGDLSTELAQIGRELGIPDERAVFLTAKPV